MIIQPINRTDAEKVFIQIHNVHGATVTAGQVTRFVGGTPAEIVNADGIQVVLINADDEMVTCAGVAANDIADNDFGLSQVYGIVNSVLLSAEADKTVAPVTLGVSFLRVGAEDGSMTSVIAAEALSTMAFNNILVLNTTNISGGKNYAKAFIRAL